MGLDVPDEVETVEVKEVVEDIDERIGKLKEEIKDINADDDLLDCEKDVETVGLEIALDDLEKGKKKDLKEKNPIIVEEKDYKVTLVKEPTTVKLISKPQFVIDQKAIAESIKSEIRRKRGKLL